MPVNIKVLPEVLANMIAAGEVVERPASVVKELVENSLDAGATRIFVDVLSGGTKLIAVSDDGSGMGADDALLAFERHATSKLASAEDLSAITTLGFRGEALPSIASVSRLRLTTSDADGGPGTLVVVEGGKLMNVKETGAPRGTIVEVRDLFFNTPARLKFLKGHSTEFGHIASAVEKTALANPGVHFRLTHNSRTSLDCPPVRYLKDRVTQVYGREFSSGLIPVNSSVEGIAAGGFVSSPGVSYPDRARVELFINGRPVKSPLVVRAIYDAYQSVLMKGRHPAAVLFVEMAPGNLDVNVHPAKREVRFADNAAVHRAVYDAVADALRHADGEAADSVHETGTPYQEGIRRAMEDYAVSISSTEPGAPPDRVFRPGFEPRQPSLGLKHGTTGAAPGPPGDTSGEAAAPRHFGGPELLQVAGTYILVPSADGCMIVDQHAAHERIQYEKIKARFGKTGAGSQGMLVPESLELTAGEAALMEGIIPELAEMGIEVEHFGGTTFLIRSKPLFMEKTDIKEAVTGMLSELADKDVKAGAEELREKLVQLMACKSAVKANQKLHSHAMDRLVRQLFECEMPYTCAHGRPTVIKFSLEELERMFKRK